MLSEKKVRIWRLIYFYEISLYFLQQKRDLQFSILESWYLKNESNNNEIAWPFYRYFVKDMEGIFEQISHVVSQKITFCDKYTILFLLTDGAVFLLHFSNSNVITITSFLDETEKTLHGQVYYLFNDFSVFFLLA